MALYPLTLLLLELIPIETLYMLLLLLALIGEVNVAHLLLHMGPMLPFVATMIINNEHCLEQIATFAMTER